MKLSDFNRLRKLMAMTFSDNDTEALTSVRAANKLLKDNGLTWQRVFDRTVRVENSVEEAVPSKNGYSEEDITTMFESALSKADGGFRDFLLSLQARYDEKGRLSEGQMDALIRASKR